MSDPVNTPPTAEPTEPAAPAAPSAPVAPVAPSAPAAPAAPKPAASGLISQEPQRTTSPFDHLFEEGVKETLPEPIKNWLGFHKNGLSVERGFHDLMKGNSEKGRTRPPPGADEETVKAFESKLRELNGVPDSPDKYEFDIPEGGFLTDEMKTKLAEYAFEKGHSPKVVNDFIPFQMELEKAMRQQLIDAESSKIDDALGGADVAGQIAPILKSWVEGKGYDTEEGAFRFADTWKLVNENKALSDRIAKLTGEDKSIHGGGEPTIGNMATIQKELDEITKVGGKHYEAFTKVGHPEKANVQARYRELMQQKSLLKNQGN